MADLGTIIHDLHENCTDDPDRQFNAAIGLGKMRDPAVRGRVVAELISALGARHQALTRAHAAEALGDLADPQAIPALITSITDSYRLVRSYAARALGKMRDAEVVAAVEPLIHQLESDDFFGARAEAAEALGNLVELARRSGLGQTEAIEKATLAVQRADLGKLKEIDERFNRIVNEMNGALKRLRDRSKDLNEKDRQVIDHAEAISGRSAKLL